MIEIKTDFIEQVIDIMKNNELSEVTLEEGENSLYIRKDGGFSSVRIKQEDEITEEVIEEEETVIEEKKLVPIVSNMIGLFFTKPSPEDKPFVQVGDRVKEGQQIGIIETIKLMNKITAETSGIVKEICIENGKPVEYGQTIMYIEQD